MVKRWLCLMISLLVVLGVFALVACTPKEKAATEDDAYYIGAVNLTSGHVFFNLIAQGLEERAKERGVKIEIRDGQGDSNVQYDEVQNFITAGVDAIVLSPADTGSSGLIDLAIAADIPAFYLNVVGQGNYTAMVMTNETQGGNNAGKWTLGYINENLGGKAKIAIITFDEIAQCKLRAEGFKEVVLKQEGIEVLAEQTYSGDAEKASAVAQDFLTQFPGLDIIFAVGDPAAQAAMEVIKAQGADTIVVGYDANPEAIAAIKDADDGKIWLADVAQDPIGSAHKMVDLIIEHLDGNGIDRNNYIDTYVIDKAYIEGNGL